MRVVARSQRRVCSFCRGDIEIRGATRCGSPSCGALYHAECWAECSAHHGSCAILGCRSSAASTQAPRVEGEFATTDALLFAALGFVVVVHAFGLGPTLALLFSPLLLALPVLFLGPPILVATIFFHVTYVGSATRAPSCGRAP